MARIKTPLESSERVCPVCGTTFIMAPQHTYKLTINQKVEYYCRYNCYRKVQKEQEAKKADKRRRK